MVGAKMPAKAAPVGRVVAPLRTDGELQEEVDAVFYSVEVLVPSRGLAAGKPDLALSMSSLALKVSVSAVTTGEAAVPMFQAARQQPETPFRLPTLTGPVERGFRGGGLGRMNMSWRSRSPFFDFGSFRSGGNSTRWRGLQLESVNMIRG